VIFTSIPTLVVRSARRKRVEAIEQDLAPTLELLATLAEAGLGFDSAIARIMESENGLRPLGQEFRIYARDNLAGFLVWKAFGRSPGGLTSLPFQFSFPPWCRLSRWARVWPKRYAYSPTT
jgi:Flp pilus assembly protein TadB